MRRPWSEAEVCILQAKYGAVHTCELAAELCRTVDAVRVAARRFGIAGRVQLTDVEERLRCLHAEGASVRTIASIVGVSERTVSTWKAELGLDCVQAKRSKYMVRRLDSHGEYRRTSQETSAMFNTYTDDQAEFLAAVAKWRSEHGRAPTLLEGFSILLGLGYEQMHADVHEHT